MKYTYYQLAGEFCIKIPLIQRDYAQGRETAVTIRKNFVAKLKEVLTTDPQLSFEDSRLHLDFVYGFTEPDNVFIPLDGQQRLTTLFLLHWYIANNENIIDKEDVGQDSVAVKRLLSRFTYKTRVSSLRFCEKLAGHSFDKASAGALSKEIADCSWFLSSWHDDPTIASMLNMLDAIHGEFAGTAGLWAQLTAAERITFEFIDIHSDKFKLTDELYIKMNSRGKPLTAFENFKAGFIDLLNHKAYEGLTLLYKEKAVSYKDYFSFNADGPWTDLFWTRREFVTVDKGIINLLRFISEMLFYNDHDEPAVFSFDNSLKEVYGKPENALFLFKSLDFLASQKNLNAFFHSVFSMDNSYEQHRVSLFEVNPADFLTRIILGTGLDIRNRVLFYALLYYQTNVVVADGLAGLRDFLRIARNLLTRVRQINTSKRIEFSSNLRLANFRDYGQFIHAFVKRLKENPGADVYKVFVENEWPGFGRGIVELEKQKALIFLKNPSLKEPVFRLEDHAEVQAITENFDIAADDGAELIDIFCSTWSAANRNSAIVRAMLTLGDFSVMTHERSRLGDIWYFGTEGNWGRILTAGETAEQKKIKGILNPFLRLLLSMPGTIADRLAKMTNDYSSPVRDYKYYFIKYFPVTSKLHQRINLFTWRDDDGFEINSLGNAGQHPLSSYHNNPYVIVLEKLLNDNEQAKAHFGRFADGIGYLLLGKKIRMYCKRQGWHLEEEVPGSITPALADGFSLDDLGGAFMLIETAELDRIAIALKFCREVIG